MTQAFPPRRPWGRGWPAPAVALALLAAAVSWPAPGLGQQPGPEAAKKGPDAAKGKDSEKAKSDEEAKAAPPADADEGDGPDRWEDPRAAEALEANVEIIAPPADSAVRGQINALAAGQGQLDQAAIDKYVKGFASELTKKANIKALADPAGNPTQAKAIEEATTALIRPLAAAPNAANGRFRQVYVGRLIEAFKPIWKGNLHSRTMAMIVLSRAGDPQAIPVFTAQLSDPDQLAIVKLLAAKGITNVTRNGRVQASDPRAASEAAAALDGLLRREPETFWATKMRVLEALGSLRLTSKNPLGGKAEFADAAMTQLADPTARPFVRVWAAWALGMMQVPNLVRNYNYALIAHAAGRAAVDIGQKILSVSDGDLAQRAWRLTDQLVQLTVAFGGEPEVRGSGLLRAPGNGAGYIAEVDKRVKALTRAGIELKDSVGVQVAGRRKAFSAAIDDLKGFLAKPPEGGAALYPGGPEFPPVAPKVAGGAGP